jgi:hypothetical protein
LIVGAIKSLLNDNYVVDEQIVTSFWTLTPEGEDVVVHGSPEYQIFMGVPPGDGILLTTLQSNLGEIAKIGLGLMLSTSKIPRKSSLTSCIHRPLSEE